MTFERKINADILLKAAKQFEILAKRAQFSQTVSADPMRTELERAIGPAVKTIATKFLHSKNISGMQININYQGPTSASFTVYADGADKDAAQSEMAAELNKLSGKAAQVMSKYQKDPLDYKYAEFQA